MSPTTENNAMVIDPWPNQPCLCPSSRFKKGERAGCVHVRFARQIRPCGECWVFAVVGKSGYGKFNVGGICRRAHRWAYENIVGPIPRNLEMDHLCRNRACVNPAHLEPVTRHENIMRGVGPSLNRARAAANTHCALGHERRGANRQCLVCRSEKRRRRIAAMEGV